MMRSNEFIGSLQYDRINCLEAKQYPREMLMTVLNEEDRILKYISKCICIEKRVKFKNS